jgi:hypothetical protein
MLNSIFYFKINSFVYLFLLNITFIKNIYQFVYSLNFFMCHNVNTSIIRVYRVFTLSMNS